VTTSIAQSRARAVADLTAGTVLATVEIARPAERVFRALTEPRELMAWWGSPETYRAHSWTADFRVGGRWRCDGKSADGRPYSVMGEFLQIAPPRRLVQTWQYDWEEGQPETKLTYTLDEILGGTRLTVRHEGFRSQEGCASHAKGWERVLDWLVAYTDAYDHPGL
jgi:uncharacterized protein YndB with AHSA1/START domain